MTLLQIKATTSSEKVNLVIDDHILPFPVDLLHPLSLTKNLEISPEFFQVLVKESVTFALFNYALRQIAMSPQTESTLRIKLNPFQKRYLLKNNLNLPQEIQKEVIETILGRLQDKGLINEIEYIKFLINRFKQRKSKQEIIFRLQRAGINPREHDLESMGLDDDSAIVKNLILKKIKNINDLTDFKTKNKVIGYLARKGFSVLSVKNVIDDLLSK